MQAAVGYGGTLPARVTAAEDDLLADLSVDAGQVMPYKDLVRWVWGWNHSGAHRVVCTRLMHLGRKLS